MPQLIRIAFHKLKDGFFKWPYQANVINILEQINKKTVYILSILTTKDYQVINQFDLISKMVGFAKEYLSQD